MSKPANRNFSIPIGEWQINPHDKANFDLIKNGVGLLDACRAQVYFARAGMSQINGAYGTSTEFRQFDGFSRECTFPTIRGVSISVNTISS